MIQPSKLKYKKPFLYETKGGYRRASWKIPPDKAGIYVIKDQEEIVYIGRSISCLNKTAYRHFQSWNCKRQYRVTYACDIDSDLYSIAVVICNAYQAITYEDRWIRKLQPRDNRDKISLFERDRREREEEFKRLKQNKKQHDRFKKQNQNSEPKDSSSRLSNIHICDGCRSPLPDQHNCYQHNIIERGEFTGYDCDCMPCLQAEEIRVKKENDLAEFILAMRISRDKFVNAVNAQEWNSLLRTSAESLLISYDQMLDKIKEGQSR